jgi:RimJ/RimL family protein N-acetyltransferase
MQLHSVEARIHATNIASAAILEATGFVKEGHLKEESHFRGHFFDTIIYSRLR